MQKDPREGGLCCSYARVGRRSELHRRAQRDRAAGRPDWLDPTPAVIRSKAGTLVIVLVEQVIDAEPDCQVLICLGRPLGIGVDHGIGRLLVVGRAVDDPLVDRACPFHRGAQDRVPCRQFVIDQSVAVSPTGMK